MKFGVNVPLLIVTLFFAASAFGKPTGKNGKKKSEPDSGRPAVVVTVVDLKVDSDKDNVKEKIKELSGKLRAKVAEHAENYQVLTERQMSKVRKRHKKAINNCYDDCDVEFGILAKTDFVIGGHLAPSANGIVGTLEIRNTKNREVVATKTVNGPNYFAFESALLSSVRRFVKPLNHLVYQATDDEVVKTAPPPEEEASEDVTGLGGGDDTVSASSSDTSSEYIVQKEEKRRRPSALDKYWDESMEEGPFLKEEDLGFDKDKKKLGIFAVGVKGGYSFNVSRAKHLRNLYTPVFHVGIELMARIHHLFEFAIVADLDYLSGDAWGDKRFGSPRLNASIAETDTSDALENVVRENYYETGNYLTIGVRPTFRLVIPINMFEVFLGGGLGINYVKTSGFWFTSATATQYYLANTGVPPEEVWQQVAYNFEKSSVGFYGVVEAAFLVRAFSDHLGVGAFLQYKTASMWQSGSKTDVAIDWGNSDQNLAFNEVSAFGIPSEKDVRNSPIGHLDALNLLTLGLIADWRF